MLVCIALLVWGLRWVTNRPMLLIDDVTVSGGETISHDDVRERIEFELRGDYLHIIPHRFFLFYPHDAIEASLKRIPRIHDITIVQKDRTTLDVTFSEYRPIALWCIPNTDTPECYFLDETGFAFAPSPALKGGAFVRHIYEDRTTLAVEQLMPSGEFTTIQEFLEKLDENLSLRVTDVIHTKEGDMYLKVNGGGEIRMVGDGSFDTALENLSSVLQSAKFKHLKPGNFQYIDVRFGNKVFVNEEEPVSATTTATTTPL